MYKVLAVKLETHDLVMKNCLKEFLKENPKFVGMKISQNYLIKRIAEFYLKS